MNSFNEFPHKCKFFRKIKDPNDFYGKEEEIESYNGICDIQIGSYGTGNVAEKSDYTIYIPLKKNGDSFEINILISDKFEGDEYGIKRLGTVSDITTSQLGFATIFIESIGVK